MQLSACNVALDDLVAGADHYWYMYELAIWLTCDAPRSLDKSLQVSNIGDSSKLRCYIAKPHDMARIDLLV